jgi:hypothetical protein
LIKRKLFRFTGLPVFATPASFRDYASLWKAALIRIGLWYSGRSFVIKDPFCLFAADFLKSGCGILPWIIVRHPADFITNSLRTATPFDFGSLEADSEFEERLGGGFRELRAYASHPDHQTLFHQNLVYWMVCAHFSLRYADEWAASPKYAFNLLDSINADPEGRIGFSLQRCGFHVAKHNLAAALERVSSPQHVKDLRKLQQSAETLNKPDPSYHGAVWTQAVKPLGPIAYIIRMRTCLLRDLGAPMSPMNAFLFLQGMETLPLRIERHCANATRAAAFLAQHPAVTRVIHPSLMEGKSRRRADAYLRGGHGSLMGIELKGGKEAGQRFIEALQMFYHVANIGDARSLAIHPATTTHSQLDESEQAASGVTPGYVRLSIGIEHIDDILADLDQALKVAQA